jgi:tRNA/tmRNA/rRNA uracil-C5-methylase (TrmA/RlmC/RlmD family)
VPWPLQAPEPPTPLHLGTLSTCVLATMRVGARREAKRDVVAQAADGKVGGKVPHVLEEMRLVVAAAAIDKLKRRLRRSEHGGVGELLQIGLERLDEASAVEQIDIDRIDALLARITFELTNLTVERAQQQHLANHRVGAGRRNLVLIVVAEIRIIDRVTRRTNQTKRIHFHGVISGAGES